MSIVAMARRGSLLLGVMLCLQSGAASAQAAAEPGEWYGWQNLTIDAASLLLVGAGAAVDSLDGRSSQLPPLLLGTGVLSLVVANPIVHWLHGNVGRGFVSLGIRAVAALLGLLGAVARAVQCDDVEAEGLRCDAGREFFTLGVLVGVSAICFDAAVAFAPAGAGRR